MRCYLMYCSLYVFNHQAIVPIPPRALIRNFGGKQHFLFHRAITKTTEYNH